MNPAPPCRPPLFAEENRLFWEFARRFMIYVLRELDKWYGWSTFKDVV